MKKRIMILSVLVVILLFIINIIPIFAKNYKFENSIIDSSNMNNDQTVIYKNVELRYQDETEWPYLHSVRINQTEKDIISSQRSMLVFDKDGNPLKLHWYIMDSSAETSYECVYNDIHEIPSGQVCDHSGGWSLYDGEKMSEWPQIGDGGPNKVAYALYCDKQITFSDGSVWDNPEYEEWLEMYKGKSVSIDVLKNYYPFVQNITK